MHKWRGTMEDETKEVKVRLFLKKAYLQWCQEKGEIVPQADFARWMGIRPASLSQWMTGQRYPEGENLARLALALGPGIYEAMGMSNSDDSSRQLNEIVSVWDDIAPDAKREVMAIIRKNFTKK